ncbi:MAG: acetamidase/formamidase family protein [Burkholderiales bacterium]|nr:acetamidase/formamidase family protein [Burkholderiales bacterium]
MHDDLRHLTLDAYPEALRHEAWDTVLERLRVAAGPSAVAPWGQGCWRASALGSVFVRLAASAQTWQPRPGQTPEGLLAVTVLEGSALVDHDGGTLALRAGDVLLLAPGGGWRLGFITPWRALAVRLRPQALLQRLLRLAGPQLAHLERGRPLHGVCSALLASVAERLPGLGQADLATLETTLDGLLTSCLGGLGTPVETGAEPASAVQASAVQLGHLQRVCRTLEARLGEADMSLERLAALDGLSTRYVQRLFQTAGTTFGDHLRERRLERARMDLLNPALARVTVAEICYRWGFSDPSNFTRAFSARYGLAPRACRSRPGAQAGVQGGSPELPRHRGRPTADEQAVEPTQVQAAPRGPATARPADVGPAPDPSFRQVLDDHAYQVLAVSLAPKRSLAADVPLPAAAGPAPRHHYVPASAQTVHWGYLSRSLKPVVTVRSGDVVTLETLTQHASDDWERMVQGDAGAQSVFQWTPGHKAVSRRGAGPQDASVFGRGSGEGFGVHICTGPVHVQGAEPGDVLEVRILDVRHRPSQSPRFRGRVFGSNAAAWWGYHYQDLLTEPRPREVVTLYEIDTVAEPAVARAVYSYRWMPQTDPDGVRHATIDYPGVPVEEGSVYKRYGVLAGACVPLRPHFGLLAVAPREAGPVDSIPPGYFGGNLDNWRAGKGARLYLPVAVDGALFSAGDPHAAQGDGEVCGTAIECSLTGVFQLVLHKRAQCSGPLAGLGSPLLETDDAWVVQGLSEPNHLADLGPQAQAEVYRRASLDSAMRDAFRKARRHLMQTWALDEDEALSLLSVGVDFGITQVADGNWGVHAVIPKALFPQPAGPLGG